MCIGCGVPVELPSRLQVCHVLAICQLGQKVCLTTTPLGVDPLDWHFLYSTARTGDFLSRLFMNIRAAKGAGVSLYILLLILHGDNYQLIAHFKTQQ